MINSISSYRFAAVSGWRQCCAVQADIPEWRRRCCIVCLRSQSAAWIYLYIYDIIAHNNDRMGNESKYERLLGSQSGWGTSEISEITKNELDRRKSSEEEMAKVLLRLVSHDESVWLRYCFYPIGDVGLQRHRSEGLTLTSQCSECTRHFGGGGGGKLQVKNLKLIEIHFVSWSNAEKIGWSAFYK